MVIWWEYKFEDGFAIINRGLMQSGELWALLNSHGKLMHKKEVWVE